MDKVLAIVGPTATGKSDLAIELAKSFNGEIINGDSVQVYKELTIGSAKVTEYHGIAHHLLDYKNVEEDYSVAEFQRDARKAIKEITERGKLPIIVGGTGLYIKALLYDYTFNQQTEIPSTDEYENIDNETLYQMLKEIDPDSCEKIHLNNRKRVIRALQIAKEGKNKTEQEAMQQHKMIYDALIISLTMDRERLKERIDRRVDKMIEEGLVQEIQNLFSRYPLNCHCFTAIGYKEMIDFYQNKKSLEQSVEDIKVHTHQFAKRQYTWLNHQLPVTWIDIETEDYKELAEQCVRKHLYGR